MLESEPTVQRSDADGAINTPDTGYTTHQGTVFRKAQGQYSVHAGGRMVACSLSSKLRKQLVYPTAAPWSIRPHVVSVEDIRMVDPVAIGDAVRFVDAGDSDGMITEVLPRRNALARRAAGAKPIEQVIVANVDQVVPVFAAANPTPKWELLDRQLAGAEAAELPAVICITKLDLVRTEAIAQEVQTYRKIGYRVICTSTVTGEGVEEFKAALRGRASVFAGTSGVGKTSLLNRVQPELGLRVNEVSRHTGKGKHTTSHLEMFALDIGGSVIDTPGMREFGVWNVDSDDMDSLFAEIRPYVGRCRFGMDCSHTHEPGCAIKAAVAAGEISERRYRSCIKMMQG